ncbi:MAG: T9SS type A sorting domain-containing protein, partial [bacterium]
EFHEGHSWGNWRAHFDDALRFLFPPDSVTAVEQAKQVPATFALQQNSPNPWSVSSGEGTKLIFSLEASAPVSLKIVNVLGQTIWQQSWPNLKAGKHAVQWHVTLPPGIYFYQLQAADKALTKKMIVLP